MDDDYWYSSDQEYGSDEYYDEEADDEFANITYSEWKKQQKK